MTENDSHLTPLLRQALDYLPPDDREPAARMATMLQVGYGTRETASALKISYRDLSELRTSLGLAMAQALREDGYSDVEVIRYLGVATGSVTPTARGQ